MRENLTNGASGWMGKLSSSQQSDVMALGTKELTALKGYLNMNHPRVWSLISTTLLGLALIAVKFGLPKASSTLSLWSLSAHQRWASSVLAPFEKCGRSYSRKQGSSSPSTPTKPDVLEPTRWHNCGRDQAK